MNEPWSVNETVYLSWTVNETWQVNERWKLMKVGEWIESWTMKNKQWTKVEQCLKVGEWKKTER